MERDATIEAALWDPTNAIQMLALSIKYYAWKGGVDLSSWNSVSEWQRRRLVAGFTSAKDSLTDDLEITSFGNTWGMSSYDIVQDEQLLDD